MEYNPNEVRLYIRKALWLGFITGLVLGGLLGFGIGSSNKEAHAAECTLDEVLVIAATEPVSQSKSGKSVDVLDSYLVSQYKPKKLVDVIQTVPGVSTKEGGAISSVRIRGTRSYDTKYLYDGVPLKDPTHPQSSFNSFLENLTQPSSEIEILKGSSSALYGSEAIGGVIDVLPVNDKWSVLGEYGPENRVVAGTPYGSVGYMEGRRKDSLNVEASHDFDGIKPFAIYQDSLGPVNDATYISGGEFHYDEKSDLSKYENTFFMTGVKIDKEPVKQTLSWTDTNRRFVFLPDTDGTYSGNVFYSDTQLRLYDTTLGFTHERNYYGLTQGKDADEADQYESDIYVERGVTIDKLNLLFGLRENMPETAKDRLTYDVSGVYEVMDGLRVRSHYGTGFRAPSLYELYGAYLSPWGRFELGNANLSPERSTSWDFGVEESVPGGPTVGITYFDTSIENHIDFVWMAYGNVPGEYNPHGVESYVEQMFGPVLVRGAYTNTWAENLLDVADDEASVTVRYFHKKVNASFRTSYKSAHNIVAFNYDTFTADKLVEDGGFTSDITVGYFVTPNVEVYGRVENLFNREYTDGGYLQGGLEAYVGARIIA